jgi:hypothetical protein
LGNGNYNNIKGSVCGILTNRIFHLVVVVVNIDLQDSFNRENGKAGHEH